MDAGVVSGLLQLATLETLFVKDVPRLNGIASKGPATASGCGGAGAVCVVAAPTSRVAGGGEGCAPASPSSRLLASDPAALATPPTPFFSSLLAGSGLHGRPPRLDIPNLASVPLPERILHGFHLCVMSPRGDL
jgi:hypothetical protein